jgi:hypothetical protein
LRERLRTDRPAEVACAAALDTGATFVGWDNMVEASQLLTIYQRRVQHLQRLRARVVGADELLSELEQAATEKRLLALRLVRNAEWNFVVMLDPKSGSQACIGVDAALGNPEFDGEALG